MWINSLPRKTAIRLKEAGDGYWVVKKKQENVLQIMVGYGKHRANRLKTPYCRKPKGGCEFLFGYRMYQIIKILKDLYLVFCHQSYIIFLFLCID